uniref:Uncharacterized protein n=1 Tax=Setaria viridis TaxID=4556 RepID=A0A4U6TQS8_SETVI|nr:hypothetical protein SEVIR_7G062900v2 [Setaria viridis]
MRIAPLPAEQGVSLFFNPAPPATLSFPSTIAQPNRAPPHARFVAPAPPPPSPSCLDLRLHSKLTDGRTRPRRPRGADLPRALHMEDCCTVQPNVFVSLGLMSWCFNTCALLPAAATTRLLTSFAPRLPETCLRTSAAPERPLLVAPCQPPSFLCDVPESDLQVSLFSGAARAEVA